MEFPSLMPNLEVTADALCASRFECDREQVIELFRTTGNNDRMMGSQSDEDSMRS